ncbi:MAG: type II toxin-antitoxin system VapC family toxin [Rhodocyclaceae bacterium]|nr:type II toxin-antitoxin system VapC family toxin [Rhodocyclaceae bacterium]MCO5096247.1 type II toxin-antitoxin system VapC family toxin [Rhodocyclaceae bacterium]
MIAYIDTSALAKCYIRELRSVEVLDWAERRKGATIAALALVEFRCMLARRRRAREIDSALERSALAQFDSHVRNNAWRIHEGAFGDYAEARDLIETLPDLPLRTLDALHLAAARSVGAAEFATSDAMQAKAAGALGFTVFDFS